MVEVVDVVCVEGEKCVDARARANKHTKKTLLIQEQNKNRNKNKNKNKTSKSQDTRHVCVCEHTKILLSHYQMPRNCQEYWEDVADPRARATTWHGAAP